MWYPSAKFLLPKRQRTVFWRIGSTSESIWWRETEKPAYTFIRPCLLYMEKSLPGLKGHHLHKLPSASHWFPYTTWRAKTKRLARLEGGPTQPSQQPFCDGRLTLLARPTFFHNRDFKILRRGRQRVRDFLGTKWYTRVNQRHFGGKTTLYYFKGPFLRGLSTEGNLRFKTDWASLIVGSKFNVLALF